LPLAISFPSTSFAKVFPENDQIMYLNWAIAILPYLEQQALFDSFQFDEQEAFSLHVSSIKDACGSEVEAMICPSDSWSQSTFDGSGGNWGRGNYGLNAFQWWPGGLELREPLSRDKNFDKDIDFNLGASGFVTFAFARGMSLSDISDGTTNTILLAELRSGLSSRDRRGVWAMGMCGSNYHCRHAAFPPNSCRPTDDDVFGSQDIIEDVSEKTLQSECMMPDRDTDLSGQSVVRSLHPGGANIGLADGSARFIGNTVETGLDGRLGVRIRSETGQTASDKLLLWQRLNLSRDGYILNSDFQ
jgi:prepilin-type processing-associated H-X9-DG protein